MSTNYNMSEGPQVKWSTSQKVTKSNGLLLSQKIHSQSVYKNLKTEMNKSSV